MPIQEIPSRQLDLGPVKFFEVYPETPAGNQTLCREGWVKKETTIIYKAQQTSVGFVPVTLANRIRWDLVYLDLDGIVQVSSGVEQVTGVPDFTGAPDPLPYCLPLAYVQVDETAAVTVVQDDITDIRPRMNFMFDSTFASGYAIVAGQTPHVAIEGIDEELEDHEDFSGKSRQGTGAVLPGYSAVGSNQYAITDGDPLETGTAKLDGEVEDHEDFSGKSRQGNGVFLPKYSDLGATPYAVIDADPLETGVAKLDIEAERVKGFIGKANLGETLPDYSGQTTHNIIAVNDPLTVAVGKLDNAVPFAGLVPTGAILYFAATAPPSGFLECNGAEISRLTYAALFAVIGTTFGIGNGIDTFDIPELRAEFLRGWDNGRGVDTARVFGSSQAEDFLSHQHVESTVAFSGGPGIPTGTGYSTTTQNTAAAGGAETRPRNVALLPCIKY